MRTVAVYLTHPEVTVDPAVPVPRWRLSAKGRERTERFAREISSPCFGRIVTSVERKATETGAILGAAWDLVPEARENLHENDRSATGFLPPDAFEAMADRFFGEPDGSVEGWERAIDAQVRIVRAVRAIVAERPETATLFIGHGAVGTLLLSALGGLPISRAQDQSAGGGHWFAFDGDTLAMLTTRWQRMESASCDLLRGPAA